MVTESADATDPLHPDTITRRFTRVHTLNVYANFLEASDRQAADVIADLLG